MNAVNAFVIIEPGPAPMTDEQQFGLMKHHSQRLSVLNVTAATRFSGLPRFGLKAALFSAMIIGGVLLTLSKLHNSAAR